MIAFVPPDVGVGRRLRAAPPPGGVEGLHERVGYFANLCVAPPPTPPDDDTATIMMKIGRMRWTTLFEYYIRRCGKAKRATWGRLELRLLLRPVTTVTHPTSVPLGRNTSIDPPPRGRRRRRGRPAAIRHLLLATRVVPRSMGVCSTSSMIEGLPPPPPPPPPLKASMRRPGGSAASATHWYSVCSTTTTTPPVVVGGARASRRRTTAR